VLGLKAVLRAVGTPAIFGILPLIVLVMTVAVAFPGRDLGVDFRGELYGESQLVIHGRDPFPPPDSDLSHGVNRIFPIPAALLAAPLTVLGVGAATIVFEILLLVAFAVTLRLLRVTDWRIYGLVLLWPPTISELQTANLTVPLALCVATAWRFRDRRFVPGIAIGVAIALKLFLWPLALLLLVERRLASAATAGAIAVAGTLLVLPFTTLGDYSRLMNNMSNTFASGSYSITGLLVQEGSTIGMAHLVGYAAGAAVLVVALSRRSIGLAVVASLMLSPIVWLHYFDLLVIPIAIHSRRLSALWLMPLAFWFCKGSGAQIHDIVIGLATLTVIATLAERTAVRSGVAQPSPAAA
jgi:hypothetical protein